MPDCFDYTADFLFEAGILSKTPRSGFNFLGSGKQSVAEHINRTVYTGYVLAIMEKDADVNKVIKMCLFHDLAETRTGDLNHTHQKYVTADHKKAVYDLTEPLDFKDDIRDTIQEYESRQSKEALIAKDADNIELILSLKELLDTGRKGPENWITPIVNNLKTGSAKKLAERILQRNANSWQHHEKKTSRKSG